jgi:hydroxymethylpyrimidine pyrophosphatase-like HAD family hydrolase
MGRFSLCKGIQAIAFIACCRRILPPSRSSKPKAVSLASAPGARFLGVHVSLKNKVSLDFLIACSGAEIFGKGGEVIERHQLLNDEAREVVELVMARGLKPVVATDSSYYRINAPLLPLFGLPIKSADKVEDVKEPIYSISLTAKTPDEACQTAALINEKFSDNLVAYQNVESVDVVPKGCSKGTGFLTVKRHFGVDVMGGIGDSFNDLPLLEAADVAYTFNRVPEGVQRAADVLVDTEAEALADLSSR